MRNSVLGTGLLIILAVGALACEIATKLSMKESLPPTFLITGNGILTSIRVRGPDRQRDAAGEAQYLYWVIDLKDYDGSQVAGRLGSVRYGEIPKGYVQRYPEKGEAPPLVENEHYYVRLVTSDAPNDDGYFTIRNGRVKFAKYESELPGR